MAHVPAYKREGFRQSLGDPRGWTLDEGDKQFGALVYRRGDEIAVVPNVPYNQPASWRAEHMRFCADRVRRGIEAKRANPSPKPWEAGEIAEDEKRAARMDALAEAMERTGIAHSVDHNGEIVPDWPIDS